MTPGQVEQMAREYGLTPSETKLVLRLPASVDELIDELYGEREDGGPLYAERCVRFFLHRVRRKLDGRASIHTKHLFELELHRGRR